MLKNCAKKSHLFLTRIASQTQNIFGLVSINLQLSKLKTISTFQNTVHNRVPIPLGFLIQFRHMDANHRQRPRDSIQLLPALLHKETDLRGPRHFLVVA